MTVAYSNSQTRYNAGDWVYTEHPTKVWYKRDSQVIETHIPMLDYQMWDHAFLTKHGVTQEEARKNMSANNKDKIFMVLRPTTRKNGKKRVKVLNPYDGKTKAIFHEQIKGRLMVNFAVTEIERWLLLDKIGTLGSTDDSDLELDYDVKTLDSESNFQWPTDEYNNSLRLKKSSYFGAACIMCPRNAYTDLGMKLQAEGAHTSGTDIQNKDTEDLIRSLMQSLGMDGRGKNTGHSVYPNQISLVTGVPHFNKNMTKMYNTKPGLGCVIKVDSKTLDYDLASLYNKQAPDQFKTKSVEDNDYQYFYVPFQSMEHNFTIQQPTFRPLGLFSNYPETGAAHLLNAL